MKLALPLGVALALFVHAAVLLFGGILFFDEEKDEASLQEVDLLTEEPVAPEKDKEDPETKEETTEELEADVEDVPDIAEVMRNLELSAAAAAPALEAASLSAIEQALNGAGGGGDFSEALGFQSGGQIGGAGGSGVIDEVLEEALDLTEIDQKPRAVFQTAPLYPAEMRGKKIEGVVTILFEVDATGKVSRPRVETASHTAFEKPALSALKQWKFEPAVKAGERVACKTRVSIRFRQS